MERQAWMYPTMAGIWCGLLAWRLPAITVTDLLLLAAWMAFTVAGTLLVAVDVRVCRLPTRVLTYAAGAIGVLVLAAAAAAGDLAILRDAAAAGIALGVGYLVLALVLPGQIGMGDVRLAALAGVILGTGGWTTVLLGACLPYVIAAPVVAVQLLRQRAHRHTQLPFGPFLIVGALTAALLTG